MDFIDQIKQFSKRVDSLKDSLPTEEATKTSIIMPFFALLGYDVFNPDEFMPEFTADVGIKKGEKVDYAILNNGEPVILIECKWIGEPLGKHDSQLFRYFATSKAKFAILTNGRIYKFYTDLDECNKMDEKPFLEIDILDIKETQVAELKKFGKSNFDVDSIFNVASELKYTNEFKAVFAAQLQNPTDDFVKLFLSRAYDGVRTQSVVDRFKPILKKALNNYITELMNDKIKAALGNQDLHDSTEQTENAAPQAAAETPASPEKVSKIVTTEEELEAFFIVKNLLKDVADMNDITYKDNERYMAILYKGKTTKWICRFYFNSSNKFLIIPDKDKKEVKYPIANVYDIEGLKEPLAVSIGRFIN
jgi:hypothetical protein